MRSRVLVWGFSNNMAGTEAVINRYVLELGEIPFDFLMYEEPINYPNISTGNNRVFVIPKKSKDPIRYFYSLIRHMKRYSSLYSAVWCNANCFANIDVLKMAFHFRIPERILHVHNAGPVGEFHTRVLNIINEHIYLRYTTRLWACSQVAGRYCYKNKDFTIIPNAIQYSKYAFSRPRRTAIREALGIGDDCLLIGTVGRLDAQKNQEWLIRLLCDNSYRLPKYKLIILGEGTLYDKLSAVCKSYDAEDKVMLAGSVEDIPSYLSAFDVFALPSLFEGLPVSLLEAQANGLPCVVSTNVTEEACISDACEYISNNNTDAWLMAIKNAKRVDFTIASKAAKSFDINNGILELKSAFGYL